MLKLVLFFSNKKIGTTEIFNGVIISSYNVQSVTNESPWNVDDRYFIFVFVLIYRISSDEEVSKSKLDCGYQETLLKK